MIKKVSVLGTGLMGTAMARAFLAKCYDVTVWNRTPSKVSPLGRDGAHIADTVRQAVTASDLVIAVPKDYDAVKEMLFHDDVGAAMAGKVLVVLSSAHNLEDPKEMETWARRHDGAYIDGKIHAFPSEIGKPEAPLGYCGDPATFARIQGDLEVLGTAMSLGANITFATFLDVTSISWYFSTVGAFLNALALCKAYDFPPELYLQACRATQPGIGAYFDKVVRELVPHDDFDSEKHQTAGIQTWFALEHFAKVFVSLGIEPKLLNPYLPILRELIARGEGKKDLAVISGYFAKQTE
jgi:3-hydroxyisobutyrate dehydrogenase-like beta-hydroxyacid dehydrogenase